MNWTDVVVQSALAVGGVSSVWLSQDHREERRKWAPIIGILNQPLWCYTAWQAQQWGIIALTVFYTASWLKGFKTYWLTSHTSEKTC